ncbi:hypothetical protein Vafri_9016 [Volvox africanus]|uniref:Exonuclease domain-containing protein n=1 Tax=Volvox africanus TaxID=51714 RepID=A0A8J4F249_9CHLO|nr:hypothetical protein Vafri_9016 [Volvox africanus]
MRHIIRQNVYIKQDRPVASYLTPLTGLTEELLWERGVPLVQALASVRSILPRDAVLIGQNIRQDVMWLGLKEGVDFEGMQDLQGLYRIWNEKVEAPMPHFALSCLLYGLLPPRLPAYLSGFLSIVRFSVLSCFHTCCITDMLPCYMPKLLI